MNKNLIWAVIVVLIVAGGAVMILQNGGGDAEVQPLGETAENPGLSAGIVEEGSGINDGPDGAGGSISNISVPNSVETKEFTVSGKNYSFSPSVINVKKGDRVKVTFMSTQGFHDFVIDEYGVATKQMQSPGTEVIEFTADKAGSFEYYCSVGSHKLMGMVGILKVE